MLPNQICNSYEFVCCSINPCEVLPLNSPTMKEKSRNSCGEKVNETSTTRK